MSAPDGINYLPSWANATDPNDLRTLAADGTLHFNDLKKIALSGVRYLHGVNTPFEPTRDMRIGTVVHFLLLGARPGSKELVVFEGGARRGKGWDSFKLEHPDAEIILRSEWDTAERMVAVAKLHPLVRGRLDGARTEVPLRWEENGIPCSTYGIDIVPANNDLGDLKSCQTTNPEQFQSLAFRMHYAHSLVWYRRGARASGMTVRRLFILGVEREAPHEPVELTLSSEMEEVADRGVDLWLEKLRGYMLTCPRPRSVYDWPGYAAAPVLWEPPKWASAEEDEEDFDEEDAAE